MTLTAVALPPRLRVAAGILATASMAFAYTQGGVACALGFVALVPWLRTLDASASLRASLFNAWAMTVAFTLAVFGWFAGAIGSYTQLGDLGGYLVLLVTAPVFQPQFLAFALVRHLAGHRPGVALRALAAASAWVAAEWLLPKVLGDTWGHGLYPARLLRQAADLGGAAGLTLMLLLANEAVAAALASRARPTSRARGLRAIARPLALAAAVPVLLASYGAAVLAGAPVAGAKPLRVGLVQSDIVDYDRLRQQRGAAAVVREVLDTHFAMSYDAVVRQHADAVLWSETVYPTTFGHARSEAGAALDREIQSIVNAANVPFVFGTYDVDADGEYNAAAFVEPGKGLLGFYRKTRLFPLTEQVPAWLEGDTLRRWLPWAGTWKAGSGARVFPLRLADGREIPVLPLICRDDVDPGLAIDGARLGAQAILTLSNDAWFTEHPRGAALHQAVAAFRSIETRLPQFRVTTNGYSAVIDASGSIVAGTRMGERTLVVGDLVARTPPRTLMVAWGDWVGRAALAFLVLLAALAALRRWGGVDAGAASPALEVATLPLDVAVLPVAARVAAGTLRTFARGGLLAMIAALAFGDVALQSNTFAQIRAFVSLFLVPEAAAWCVLRAFAARATIADGLLVLSSGGRQLELALADVAGVEPWRLPVPGPGLSLRLASGERWRYGLALSRPDAFARLLAPAGVTRARGAPASAARRYGQAAQALRRNRLDAPWIKFGLLPLLLALPAFRLHQHIAYGGTFGEYLTFGLKAYLTTFGLWWAAWIIGVVLCAAALRAAIEAGTLAGVLLAPARALDARRVLERISLAALYLGLPIWLVVRISGV
jgi:apolipoprotein N-acyltransferase